MSISTTIELPLPTYQKLQAIAQQRHRPIAEVVAQWLTQEEQSGPPLPILLEEELAALSHLSDELLWLVARSTLTAEQSEQLEELTWKAQRSEGLTNEEVAEQNELLKLDQQTLVRRTEAANLLRQRGHEISTLLHAPR